MSLRLRLLLAVGAIAIIALVVADFATYSALRTSLYNQVDQQLAQHRPGPAISVASGNVVCNTPQSGSGLGGSARSTTGAAPVAAVDSRAAVKAAPPTSSASATAPWSSRAARSLDGLECPAYVGKTAYRPQLPDPITGFTTQPDGTEVAYFTTGSIASGGPAFRVRAVKAQNGAVLVDRRSRSSTRPARCTRSSSPSWP